MKHKATWHEYGLGLLLILSALEGGIRAFHGDVAAGIGTILLPAVFWLVFYWQHFWRDKPKPLNWTDTVLGLLAWLWAIGFMIQHH